MVNPLTSQTPISDSLNSNEYTFADSELQAAAKRLGLFSICAVCGVMKRRGGTLARQLVFSVLVWPFIKKDSLRMFCLKHLKSFIDCAASTLYRFLGDETANWRGVTRGLSKNFYRVHDLGSSDELSFVLDDSVKKRRGRKVEGCSTHFDHAESRCVHGQQVVQLGLAHEEGFLPLDAQIYMGEKKRREVEDGFEDERSSVARDYRVARDEDKNQIARGMVTRAVRAGFRAAYMLADSWFCNKANIAFAISKGLTAVMRMKRAKTKYRYCGRLYTLVELYNILKRRMKKLSGLNWRVVKVTVEMNLAPDGEPPRWTNVTIVFSAPKNGGKNKWAAFLSTDLEMSAEKVLEVYSRRWGIEVYFKEVKQNMGWLAEQTGRYAAHYASIHLASIRYILLADAVMNGCFADFATARAKTHEGLEALSFMKCLWTLFKSAIWDVLDQFVSQLGGEVVEEIKALVAQSVEGMLEKALQIDEHCLLAEKKALNAGIE